MENRTLTSTQRSLSTVTAVFLAFQAIGAVVGVLVYISLIGFTYFDIGATFALSAALSVIPLYFLISATRDGQSFKRLSYVLIGVAVFLFCWKILGNFDYLFYASGPLLGTNGLFVWYLGLSSPLNWLEIPIYLVLGISFYSNATTSRKIITGTPERGEVYSVQVPFVEDKKFSFTDLQELAKQKIIQPDTVVKIGKGKGNSYPAMMIPGLYSDKSMTTAVLLGFFLGNLGIDRFYLGYTGLGILKLLTFGGCGIWGIVDIVLIATRKLPDSTGRPLR